MRRTNAVIALLACSAAAACGLLRTDAQAPSTNLLFAANAEEARYKLGEKVHLSFSLWNHGTGPLLVSQLFLLDHDLEIEIVGPDKLPVSMCGVLTRLHYSDDAMVRLEPKQSVTAIREITCEEGERLGFSFTKPGRYVATARYSIPWSLREKFKQRSGTAKIPTGQIAAPAAQLEIVPEE
jgi:hypothetical protein